MVSLWVHSLLPLLLFLFYIRLLPGQHEHGEVFTTNAVILTATCSWFCKIILEFFSMSLCKILFSSSNASLPSSILEKKIDAISRSSHQEISVKRCSFLPRLLLWTLVDPFCAKRLFSREPVFFPDCLTRDRNGFVLQRIQVFSRNK